MSQKRKKKDSESKNPAPKASPSKAQGQRGGSRGRPARAANPLGAIAVTAPNPLGAAANVPANWTDTAMPGTPSPFGLRPSPTVPDVLSSLSPPDESAVHPALSARDLAELEARMGAPAQGGSNADAAEPANEAPRPLPSRAASLESQRTPIPNDATPALAAVVPTPGPSPESPSSDLSPASESGAPLSQVLARPPVVPAMPGEGSATSSVPGDTGPKVPAATFEASQRLVDADAVDDMGRDPAFEKKLLPLLDFLYSSYFRVDCEGLEHIPSGRCILVANHSGTIPLDGVMMKMALRSAPTPRTDARWLAEDAVFHLPFVGSFLTRLGAVRACQENAELLLRRENLVTVFPEGTKGVSKLYRDRYRLQRFGRGGFVRLALRTQSPVLPVAIVGAEETYPLLGKFHPFTSMLGLPFLPITPTFPLFGLAGLMPLPSKWRIVIGKPIAFDGLGSEAAEDELRVGQLAERVRGQIQAMIDDSLRDRRSVFRG